MKCMKCGNEVEIGEVYCQVCGTAIQIVPEYNPLEEELETVLEPAESRRERVQREEQRRQKRRMRLRKRKIQRAVLISVMVLVVAAIAGGVIAYTDYKTIHSFEYQYRMGNDYFMQGEYGKALEHFHNAMNYDAANTEVRISAAQIYSIQGDYNRSVELLLEWVVVFL